MAAGALLAQNADAAAEAQNQLVGLIGLLALAAVTATQAGLAVKWVRQNGSATAAPQTIHPVCCQKRAECRPLHQQSPPSVGGSFC
jgi:hypothetical protein